MSAEADADWIEPDTPERDPAEENSGSYLTFGASHMEHWAPEWKCVLLHMTPLYIVIMHESTSIWGDHMAYNWCSIENLQN